MQKIKSTKQNHLKSHFFSLFSLPIEEKIIPFGSDPKMEISADSSHPNSKEISPSGNRHANEKEDWERLGKIQTMVTLKKVPFCILF